MSETYKNLRQTALAKGIALSSLRQFKKLLKDDLKDDPNQFNYLFPLNNTIHWDRLEQLFKDKSAAIVGDTGGDYEAERLRKIKLENAILEVEKQAKVGEYIKLSEQIAALKAIARFLQSTLIHKLKYEYASKAQLTPAQIAMIDEVVKDICKLFKGGKYE